MNIPAPHTPSPARPASVRLFKITVAALALAACATFGWHLLATGAIDRIGGVLILRTGDYFWQFIPGPALVIQWLAALLLIVLAITGGSRPAPATRQVGWGTFLMVWTALTLTLLLAAIQLSGFSLVMPSFAAIMALVAGLATWLLARPGQPAAPLATLARGLSDLLARPRSRALVMAALTALTLALAIVACRVIYQGNPLVTDSQSQIAQARLLLDGHWRLDISQSLRDVIAFPYATTTVPSFSQYPPGQILLLVPVLALGLPAQTINFLAGALTALLVMRLALRIYGAEASLIAGILMAGSPFILVMNGGAMNHVLTACLLVAALACLMPLAPGQTVGRGPWLAFLGGLCLGWAAATRPLTGLAHGLVWGLFAMALLLQGAWQWRQNRSRIPTAPPPLRTLAHGLLVTLGVVIPTAVFLFYNWKTTGNALVPGYLASNPELHRLGFRAGGAYPYSPLNALNNSAANLFSLNTLLLGWPTGSLAILAIWFIRTRLGLAERVLLALIATQTILYAFYQFHDLFLGPRFLFEIAPLLILLAAGGLASRLKGRDCRAGVLWLIIIAFSVSGGIAGLNWWSSKHGAAIAQHTALEQYLQKTLPVDRDTVIVLREPAEEMIGRHFSPPRPGQPTLWFVPAKKEAQARKLPELQGFQWLYYPSK